MMERQLDISQACPLCKMLLVGDLAEARSYLNSVDHFTDQDNTAVYLVIKHYSQFLVEFSQQNGETCSAVWNSSDEKVKSKRNEVTDLLKQMFKRGMSINCTQTEETPLFCAIGTHDEDLVKLLLENGADANALTPNTQMNAIALAIILNDAGILKLLLSFGSRVNDACCQRLTPLQLSMNKSINVSKVLLENGADVQQVMQMRGSSEMFITSPPLIYAVETNNQYLASILLEHGEDVNQSYGECSDSSIHLAIKQGNNDMVKLLIQNGANLNKRNGRGCTPLGLALHQCEGDISITETLLLAGCSMTKGSIINVFRKHFPPLHIAAFLGSDCHFDAIKLLIEKSFSVEREMQAQQDLCVCELNTDEVLHKTARKTKQGLSSSERAVDLQLQGRQDFINMLAIDKSTALYMAVLGGNLRIAEYLVEKGANPYNTCWYGSLLHAAVMARRKGEDVLKFALQFDYDIDQQNEDGNTCLILAARNNTPAVCAMLLEKGALLNVQDGRYGETALSASVYFGFEDNAELLLSCGANPDLPDFRETSALYWAVFNCREKCLRLLLEAGASLTRTDLANYPKNIKVMKNAQLKELLHNFVSEPRSLQQCCRLALRKHLVAVHHGKSIMSAVKSLPLPGKLKNYLALKSAI